MECFDSSFYMIANSDFSFYTVGRLDDKNKPFSAALNVHFIMDFIQIRNHTYQAVIYCFEFLSKILVLSAF